MKRFEIASVVKDLGISAHLKGYHYMISGIQAMMEDISLATCMMKVYSSVAKEYGITASRVERAMRHAIELGWDRANPETVKRMFGYSVGNERPTVSEFVATIADYLLMVGDEK